MALLKILNNFGINDYFSLAVILLIIYVAQYYYKYFTRVNPLPGPFPLPFFGNLIEFYWYNDLKAYLLINHKKYGDIFEVYLGIRRIILSRPEDIEKLLVPSTKSQYMTRFPYVEGLAEIGMMGKGILANDDLKSWRYNRQFFTQAILAPKFTQEVLNWTEKLFDELESYWSKLYLNEETIKENKNVLDFSAWLNRYTNDMIIALTTGERSYTMAGYFNIQGEEKAEHPLAIVENSEKFVRAFRKHLLNVALFVLVPSFIRHYIPFVRSKTKDLIKNVNYIYSEIDAIVKRRKEEIANTPLDKPLPHDMLTSVITANTPRDINYTKTVGGEALERPMNDIEIRHIMFDGFIGGTDTTANMIAFIIYFVAHHPEVKKKILEEIDRVFKGDKTRPITESDLHSLKYCEAVIKEVDRVHPVANMLARYATEPDEIAGYKWPAGTMFQMNAVTIHRHKDHWVEPDKFNPDRWMDEGFEPKKYSFVMFGGGLRICPGRKLAMIELVSLMALLYRRYEIDLVDMNAPLKTKSIGITACTELLVKVKPRN